MAAPAPVRTHHIRYSSSILAYPDKSDFPCNDGFLFNVEGECVNGTAAPERVAARKASSLVAILDPVPSETSQATQIPMARLHSPSRF